MGQKEGEMGQKEGEMGQKEGEMGQKEGEMGQKEGEEGHKKKMSLYKNNGDLLNFSSLSCCGMKKRDVLAIFEKLSGIRT